MGLIKRFFLVSLLAPFMLFAVGCDATEQQVATDQELSEYGQSAAPQEMKDALERFNKQKNKE